MLRIVGNREHGGIDFLEQLNPGLGGQVPDCYRVVLFVDHCIQ
jgi:hypothetical protein